MTQRNYNVASGLVFDEQVIRAPPTESKSFFQRCTGQRPDRFISKRRGGGAASLQDVATRSILCNLDFLTPEVLKCVPVVIVKRLWDVGLKSSLDSIRTWQLFVLAHPKDPPFYDGRRNNSIYKRHVSRPETRLDSYLCINSNSFAWLSFLTISDISFSYEEFVKIGYIKNLRFLHVASSSSRSRSRSRLRRNDGDLDSCVDDSVIRGWSRMAAAGDAFQKLEVVVLKMQRHVNMRRCLEYFGGVGGGSTSSSAFPVLMGLCFYTDDSDVENNVVSSKIARERGWKRSTGGFYDYAQSRIQTPKTSTSTTTASSSQQQNHHRHDKGVKDEVNWFTLVEDYLFNIHSPSSSPSSSATTITKTSTTIHLPPLLSLSLGSRDQYEICRVDSMREISWFERCRDAYIQESSNKETRSVFEKNKKSKMNASLDDQEEGEEEGLVGKQDMRKMKKRKLRDCKKRDFNDLIDGMM